MMYNVIRNKINNTTGGQKMTKIEEQIRICKGIYNNAKNYNLAQDVESKLVYASIINSTLECLVYTGVIIRYDINRDRNDNEKIAKIVLLFEELGTIDITID